VPNTWIVDLADYLDGSGRLAALPTTARRLANHFGAIVAAMSSLLPARVTVTQVRCRRRPLRRPCTGSIQAVIDDDAQIRWQCAECGDNGLIAGWQGTPWDARRVGSLH